MWSTAVLVLLSSVLISGCTTHVVQTLAVRRGLFDQTHSSRKVHGRLVPRLGGLGFILGTYGAIAIASLYRPVRDEFLRDGSRLAVLALAGLAIATLGIWDDLRGANARQKLTVQLAVALALYFAGYGVYAVESPLGPDLQLGAFALPVTVLWIVGISNAMNLVDGLDGLAGGIAVAAAMVVLALAVRVGDLPHALVAVAVVGGLAAFLFYNVNPASIFMGDTGSLFLGMLLATLALGPRQQDDARHVPLVAMVVALGVPIADTILAILRRAGSGTPIFSADREHIHHRLLDRGLSHRQAVFVLWSVAAALACAAIAIAFARNHAGTIAVAALTAAVFALNRLGMVRVPSPLLWARRRKNRDRFRIIRAVCARIRGVVRVADLHREVDVAAAAIDAESVWLKLAAEAAPETHARPGTLRSFPIDPFCLDRGVLEVVQRGPGRCLDRDAEAAIEILCRQLADALQRIESTAPAWPGGHQEATTMVDRTREVLATGVLGVPVSGRPLGALLDIAFRRIGAGQKTLFSTANAHSIVVAQRVPDFASHFREADAVLPDGVSAVWGVRACGGSAQERVSGPDFFQGFLARASEAGVSVFLLGADDATLERLSERCRARWPRLVIKGTLAPPYGELSHNVNRHIVDAVNRVRPDALFVAMTAPKQELWLSRHLPDLDVAFAMGVGAAFDFIAGTKRRAPRFLGRIGIEWLFRLALEPRRLWRRNVDSAVFVSLLADDMLRRTARWPVKRVDGRAAARRSVRYPVQLGAASAYTVNISESGLCLESNGAAVPAGASLQGSILLDGRHLAFAGRVAWARGASAFSTTRRMGLRFTKAPAGVGALGAPPRRATARTTLSV